MVARRSWFKSIREMLGSLWFGVGALVSAISTLLAIYQGGVEARSWPAFPLGGWVEPWHFFTLGYVTLAVTAIAAYHKLAKQADDLKERLEDAWRTERKELEGESGLFRNELSQFLPTVEAILIAGGQRQKVSTWEEYLSAPPSIDDALYIFAQNFWRHGWSDFFTTGEASFQAFKARFRIIYSFFDRLWDALQDFPERAPEYVDSYKHEMYPILHLVWYFGHASRATTFGPRQLENDLPQRWDLLWRRWNDGVDVPRTPGPAVFAGVADGEALPISAPKPDLGITVFPWVRSSRLELLVNNRRVSDDFKVQLVGTTVVRHMEGLPKALRWRDSQEEYRTICGTSSEVLHLFDYEFQEEHVGGVPPDIVLTVPSSVSDPLTHRITSTDYRRVKVDDLFGGEKGEAVFPITIGIVGRATPVRVFQLDLRFSWYFSGPITHELFVELSPARSKMMGWGLHRESRPGWTIPLPPKPSAPGSGEPDQPEAVS